MSTKDPFSRLAFTMMRLHAHVADAAQTKLKFEAKFDSDPVYAIEWLQNTPKALIMGQFATLVVNKCIDKSDEEQLVVITNMLAEVERRIELWRPQHGSSLFSNAVEEERLFALRETRDTLKMAFEPEEKK